MGEEDLFQQGSSPLPLAKLHQEQDGQGGHVQGQVQDHQEVHPLWQH
jgi:hypothetical protein